ncbi:MAG TPA: M20/M25/M40 family metallo-hydrolase [Acidobacteriaceae bacterium]|nr:M20/M25/M40 family metallo-hydrolase [Acidobacteriaceae bacterium]
MQETYSTSAFHTVSQLAGLTAVHRAFQWFHLQEPKLREWHRQVASIPAPPFGEQARAQWMVEQFTALGLENVHIDACGNALGSIYGAHSHSNSPSVDGASPFRPCTLLSAHLDTVFPADAIGIPVEEGSRLLGPGVSDNCAGIVALLATAAAMQSAGVQPATDILFAGNVGEEGEGNLRGMRYLFTESPAAARIRSVIVLDGAGTDSIVIQALGSKRFNVVITGPGGHSWIDARIPNPILVLSNALAALGKIKLPGSPRTTWNVGHIEGGTAINAIPQSAQARIDTRSTDASMLLSLEREIFHAVEQAICEANSSLGPASANEQKSPALRFQIETIGERPAATLDDDAGILLALRAIDRHLGIHSQPRIASTDANIPLSLGIEAVSIGSGGRGGGVHTRQEWFDAAGRDLALRRILLLLLALAQAEI